MTKTFNFASAAGMILLVISICDSQQKVRTIDVGTSFPNQPIKIVDRQIGNSPFMDEKRVLADRNWLKNLQLAVENVSKKTIVSFDINLLIIKQGRILMGLPIRFNTYSTAGIDNALDARGEKKLGSLAPGETIKVRISERDMSAFESELKKKGLEDLDRVTVEFRSVHFNDGTQWFLGQTALRAGDLSPLSVRHRKGCCSDYIAGKCDNSRDSNALMVGISC